MIYTCSLNDHNAFMMSRHMGFDNTSTITKHCVQSSYQSQLRLIIAPPESTWIGATARYEWLTGTMPDLVFIYPELSGQFPSLIPCLWFLHRVARLSTKGDGGDAHSSILEGS